MSHTRCMCGKLIGYARYCECGRRNYQTDPRKQSLYFDDELVEEIEAQAARLERSLSWIVQRCIAGALPKIRELPSLEPPEPVERKPKVSTAAVAIFALLFIANDARAQGRDGDALALARVCASEAGLLASEGECAAIAAVLRARCPECRLETSARQYSRGVFNASRTDARAWVVFLRADGRTPHRWPTNASWTLARPRWLALLATAERIVRGEIQHVCSVPPKHWGGTVDRARAQRLRLVRIECGETRNDFYALPRDDACNRSTSLRRCQ